MKYIITKKNIAYINKICDSLQSNNKPKELFLINKDLIKDSLKTNLINYIDKLNKLYNKDGFSFEIHFKLLELLQIFHDNKDIIDSKELLRLLGMVCNYAFIGPQTIHLDLTNACNTDCIYCWWHSPLSENRKNPHYHEWKKKSLDLETIRSILNDAKDLNVDEILLTGQGEPLAHPEIKTIIPEIKQKGFHTTIFTNGRLLTKENSELLIDNKIDILYLSFSAVNYKTYQLTHPTATKDAYDKIIKRMKYLLYYARKNNNPTYILFCFVITNQNYQYCSKFISLAKEIGISDVRFQMMDPIPNTKQFILDNEQLKEFHKELNNARKKANEFGIKICNNINVQEETINTKGSWEINTESTKKCLTGWYFTRIWSDYNVSFCCSEKHIASLQNQTFKEIWNGRNYNTARYIGKKYSPCFTCTNNRKLIDSSCNNCGNYEYIENALKSLTDTQIINFLD